jgi:ATP-dependent protease ClpP protease subunit
MRSQDRGARPGRAAQSWYTIRNAGRRPIEDADRNKAPTYAEVYLYDEIGWFGITADEFVAELTALDVDEIDLHLNSPGGDVFDGIAIWQALINHRATVCVYVDSLAASIASVIAMAGDRVVMGMLAQMMIHDAWGMCVGNAQDMRQFADELDRFSNTIAKAYADKAGGTPAQWRKSMLGETWYDAAEAVAAGLADEVGGREMPAPDESVAAAMSKRHEGRARGWRYDHRENAPAAVIDPEPEPPADGGWTVVVKGTGEVEPAPAEPDLAVGLADLIRDVIVPPEPEVPMLSLDDWRAVMADAATSLSAPPALPADDPTPAPPTEIEITTALQEALQP